MALANWCQINDLARRHEAHLNRVIQLAPDHAEARLRLGYRRTAEGWVRQSAFWQGVRDRLAVSESIGRWKPVLDEIRNGLNRRGERLDTLECSGGHPFWVSGDGWIQARHLQPGMCLHGLRGGVRVLEIETGSRQETDNLIVAEHQTYFVGEDRLLCHDNTERRPTNATVPGLQED